MFKTRHNSLLFIGTVFLCQMAMAADVPATVKLEKVVRGLLMQHAGKMIFSPCNERIYAELDDSSPQNHISKALQNFGLSDQKPLYVEFIGRMDKGIAKVSWLNFADQHARCQASARFDEKWRALGDSPNWSLRVGENQMKLEREGQATLLLNEAMTSIENELVQLSAKNPPTEDWILSRELCTDAEKKHLFGWRANLKSGGQTLHGCAWQGY